MTTFNKAQKAHWISIMQEHQDADRLTQGLWWSQDANKGCFFGCAMQSEENVLEHASEAMNLPKWLVYLAEKIFERLPKDEALTFPVELLKAIPTDVNIDEVKHKIAIKRLSKLDQDNLEVSEAIQGVIACHEQALEGTTGIDWNTARSVARSVAWSAEAAARSAAWSAAWSVAWSAEADAWSARSAAWSAAWSVAWSAEADAWSAWSVAESAAESARSAEAAAWSAEADAWSAWSVAESAAESARSAEAAARSDAWSLERNNLISELLTLKGK